METKFLFETILGQNKFLDFKNFGSKENYGSKENVGFEKHFRSKIMLGKKKLLGSGWGVEGLLLRLRETYIPNLNTLLSLKPLEKVSGGGG